MESRSLNRRDDGGKGVVRLTGAFITVFSIFAGLLLLFVVPSACGFVAGIELLFLAALFIAGLLILLLGKAVMRRKPG
jgi:hypothetical protein